MAWIEGTEERNFVVKAPLDVVAEFFSSPEQIRHCMGELESYREIEPNTYEWILKEKSEKGITFQAVYTVRYERQGNEITWKTVGEGTVRSEGKAVLKEMGDKTEVQYRETIASDLPIPKLAAKVFKPIVAREIRKDVGTYLDAAQKYIETQAVAS